MPDSRRFPPPWTVEEMEAKCFIVRDHNGKSSPTSISRTAETASGGEAAHA